jgi:hypothetical protein
VAVLPIERTELELDGEQSIGLLEAVGVCGTFQRRGC